jgi:hypothetical protein
MSASLKFLPLLAKIVLIAGLFCGVISSQLGFTQSAEDACVMADKSAADAAAAPMVGCGQCCAAMPCCLTSKPDSDTPLHPQPLSNERSRQVDHSPVAMTLALIPTFDFLAAPPKAGTTSGNKVLAPTLGRAPRGGVSCIWLI